jgi:hypothetical protein
MDGRGRTQLRHCQQSVAWGARQTRSLAPFSASDEIGPLSHRLKTHLRQFRADFDASSQSEPFFLWRRRCWAARTAAGVI